MENELSKYRWFRNTIRQILLLGGLWPRLEETCRMYRVIAITSAFIIAAMASKMLGFCLANITRLSIFVKGMCLIFSYWTSVLKVGYFVKYRQDLVLLDSTLGRKFEEELEVREHRPLLLRQISQYTRLTLAACSITATTLGVLSVMPIIFTLKYKKYLYIFQGKYPFPVEGGSLLYWIVVTVEASAGFWMFTLVSGVDNAFGLHIFRMCGMLRLLGHKYSHLRSVAELTECVRTHQMILRCRDALQRVYGPIVLLTYLTSSLIMCSIMYQVDQKPWVLETVSGHNLIHFGLTLMVTSHRLYRREYQYGSMSYSLFRKTNQFLKLKLSQFASESYGHAYVDKVGWDTSMCSIMYQVDQLKKQHMTFSKAFFLVFYITLKLLQAFTYAYYGALISEESENCLNAVYKSDWAASGNLRLMKNILMIRTQKPIILNVKNFFFITMDMFAKIVNTTISYFFLLQTVTKED